MSTTQGTRGPKKASVTMYNVGFGDCFLLSFEYARGKVRRVLIDCGSKTSTTAQMTKVVDQVVSDSGGRVDALVVTHRHLDHLSAFGAKGLGEKLEGLKPALVIQPWTEHPKADKAALEAPTVFTKQALRHLTGLVAAQEFATRLVRNPGQLLAAAGPGTQKELTAIAALSIPNEPAVKRIEQMKARHAYVHAGSASGLETLLPGVKVTVLGPPTLKQADTIRRQTRWDDDEFWKLRVRLSAACGANLTTKRGSSVLFRGAETDSVARAPSYVRWMVKKLDEAQLLQAKEIVRSLDDALNNTSVILLFEFGGKALLFPGDAQLESWQYALSDPKTASRLKKVTVYKVGHHGSANATPKSLWKLLPGRGAKRQRLVTLLSTKKGAHAGVPNATLVEALGDESELHSTEGNGRTVRWSFDVRP